MGRHAGTGVAIAMLAALATLAAPTLAAARPTLVKGGPRTDRGRVEAALTAASMAMQVCWRAAREPTVRVKVAVAADGAVTATAITKGGPAQCAAGILAVWTLPGGPWQGEVDFAVAAPDLSAFIQQQLLAHGDTIRACQSQAPTAAGSAGIKMKIHPDGSITDVEVSSPLGARVDACVQRAVEALRLEPTGSAGAIRYQLAVAFTGKGGAGAGDGAAERPPADPDGGSIDGALGVEQVRSVLGPARPRLVACGQKGKGKGTVVVRFTVRPDGTTKNVLVKDAIGDAAIEGCLVAGFKALRFPAAAGETRIVYPVAFR